MDDIPDDFQEYSQDDIEDDNKSEALNYFQLMLSPVLIQEFFLR